MGVYSAHLEGNLLDFMAKRENRGPSSPWKTEPRFGGSPTPLGVLEQMLIAHQVCARHLQIPCGYYREIRIDLIDTFRTALGCWW